MKRKLGLYSDMYFAQHFLLARIAHIDWHNVLVKRQHNYLIIYALNPHQVIADLKLQGIRNGH
ncbi:hypothetical protein [Vibrio algarum]|uniref:Uncharacterized protein n=1 Tax=Vibrio algarum TaxID=3020714 RepID=A0ABT4YM14_9VIBR|nr:hypothetical protein [Vibrio sp. KJ40-1]MDB1122592.1 hypothetical protein [Vibrio sp. KJ40-1]